MTLRQELLKKLARSPYRYDSNALWRSTEKATWTEVDRELAAMKAEGVVHAQNGMYIRVDRLYQQPPEKQKKIKKTDPRQRGFGFE